MKDKERKVTTGGNAGPKVPAICLDLAHDKDDPYPSDKSRITSQSQLSHHQGSGAEGASGAMTAKRLVKRFSRRNSERRESVFHGSHHNSHQAVIPSVPKLEPTYQLEPKYTFNVCAVEKIVKNVLTERLEGLEYDPAQCGRISKLISGDIKDRVKHLKYDRCKIVCYVTLGENKGQGVMATSRCAWDPKSDSYASYTLTTKELFCTTCVFGVYAE